MARKGSATDRLIEQLTETIAELNARIAEFNERLRAREAREAELLANHAAREAELVAQLDALKRQLLGKKTEKMPRPKDAMRKADGTTSDPKKATERRRANAEARAELPTEIEAHRVPDAERSCPTCGDGSDLRPLGEGRRTTEFDYVPGYFRRRVHVQEVLACTCGTHVVTAPAPSRVYDQCQYGPGFLAHLIVAKCADSIPIFRLEKAYARLGIPVSRSTMNELFHRSAELLAPIHERLLASMRDAFVVHADETPMLMHKTNRRGYVWTFRTEGRIAYVFSKGRGGDTPRSVLGGSRGVLVVDAYTGYNAVLTVDGRKRAGCLAHVRRKFFEALGSAPDLAQRALDHVLALYRVEHVAKDRGLVGSDTHRAMRQSFGRLAMTKLLRFLRENRDAMPPRSTRPANDVVEDASRIRQRARSSGPAVARRPGWRGGSAPA